MDDKYFWRRYKMNDKSTKNGNAFKSFIILLQALFIILKLTNVIAWDWIYVLLPILFFIVMALVILTIAFILKLILYFKLNSSSNQKEH